MQVISAIEAKVKELMDQKSNHQSLALRLASDLDTAKSAISKIEGALEAFAATNSSLKSALGVVEAVSTVVGAASSVVDAAANAAPVTVDASNANAATTSQN